MMLLRLISWPYFRRHVLRTLLTTAGIVLGVAVFVGMHTANQSVLFAFSRTVDRIAGKTELQVTAGETGFDEEILERVQAAPTVRGIMRSSGLTSAFGGNLAIMDIYAAQKMFGRGRTFDRIDVAAKPGRTIQESATELRAILGPGFTVEPPSGRGQQFESMIAAYSMMVNISSLFALFIGMFIIYNSFAIAVTQRRSEIGILRALGATRAHIRWLFLGESALTGLVGSLGGLAFGLLIARGIAETVGGLVTDVYGVAHASDEIATSSP